LPRISSRSQDQGAASASPRFRTSLEGNFDGPGSCISWVFTPPTRMDSTSVSTTRPEASLHPHTRSWGWSPIFTANWNETKGSSSGLRIALGRAMTYGLLSRRLVEPLVDLGDLLHPPLTLPVVEVHDLPVRPMKVIRDVGYLLKQAIWGAANHSPGDVISASTLATQHGRDTPSGSPPSRSCRGRA